MLAIIAIGTERQPAGGDRIKPSLATPLTPQDLKPSNVSSIAATVGLNRETVRRRVLQLIEIGAVERDPDGGVRITRNVVAHPEVIALLNSQLQMIVRTVNDLGEDGLVNVID